MRRIIGALAIATSVLAALGMAGCGGSGGGEPAAASPPAVRDGYANIGPQGGRVLGVDGAEIVVAAGALGHEATLTIARDATHAPAVPLAFPQVGQVWALTPHGGQFSDDVTVRIPYDAAAVASDERVVLLKAGPNDIWQVIDDVSVQDGFVTAKLRSFSFLTPVRVPSTTPWFTPSPPPTEAQFSLELLNANWPNLVVAPGAGVRMRQQNNVDEPAQLRVDFAVPATASLVTGSACNPAAGNHIVVRLAQSPATVYRVPGESGSRVAVDPSPQLLPENIGVISHDRYGTYSVDRTVNALDFPQYLTRPDANPLWVRDRLPAGAIVDAHAVHVALQVVCVPHGGSHEFELPAPVPPIVVVQGFPPANVYLAQNPAPPMAAVGQMFSARFEVSAPRGGWIEDSTEWEVSDPGGTNFTPVANAPLELDGNLQGGVYGFFRNPARVTGSGMVELIARGTLADNGRLLRATGCMRLRVNTSVRECATTRAVPITITPVAPTAPRITLQPASATLRVGQSLNLVAGWEATPEPRVAFWEWRPSSAHPWELVSAYDPWNWEPGAGRPYFQETRISSDSMWRGVLLLNRYAPLTVADSGMQFRVTYFNDVGTVTSDVATIMVVEEPQPPAVTTEPRDTSVALGAAATLAAAASGSAPLSYQWLRDGAPISGANAPTLTIDPVNSISAGSYQLEVSNGAGTVRTRAARLTVTAALPSTPTAPALDVEPAPLTVAAGSAATFAVGASGSAPLAYQWRRDGAAIPGANGPVLALAGVTAADAAAYSVVVSNVAGSVTSRSAMLAVTPPAPAPQAPTISTEPLGLSVLDGQAATLAVAASGSAPLTYQWYRDGAALPASDTPVLAIAAARSADAGNYTVKVSNAAGSVVSRAAGLVVTPPPGAPTIVTQPAGRSVGTGQAVAFAAAVTGNPAPLCLWMRNGIAIAGATSCTGYTLPAATLADNGAVFSFIVYNAGGFVLSNPAVLTVTEAPLPPTITTDLVDVSAPEGGSATFTVAATANGPLHIYWVVAGAPTAPLGGNTFTYGPLQASDNGRWVRALVCNGPLANNVCTASRDATITVTPALPANALTATQVVAGNEWGLALRPDRTVWGWGLYHKTDGTLALSVPAGQEARRPVRLYPAVLSDVHAIAGWYDGFWALKGAPGSVDSRVLHWGRARNASDGRSADGAGGSGSVPQFRDNYAAPVELLELVSGLPRPVDRVCRIAGGSDRVALIRAIDDQGRTTNCAAGSAKTVWFVGALSGRAYESSGLVAKMPGLPQSEATGYSPPATIDFGQSSSGAAPLLITLEDGRAFAHGENPYNGLGLAAPAPGFVGGIGGPAALRAEWGSVRGGTFSYMYSLLALRSDGSVAASGYNSNDELGLGDLASGVTVNGPQLVLAETCGDNACTDRLSGVSALASTDSLTTLALKGGQILGWGSGANGLLGPGLGAGDVQSFPRVLPGSGSGYTAISAAHAHALAIGAGGGVYAWGSGARGALGDGTDGTLRTAPALVTVP